MCFAEEGLVMRTLCRMGEFVCTDIAEQEVELLTGSKSRKERDALLRNCLITNKDDPVCSGRLLKSQCFETLFNTTAFLFHCLPGKVTLLGWLMD